MTPRLSGHFSIFGLVFFVLKSLLGIARQWSCEKFAILTLKPGGGGTFVGYVPLASQSPYPIIVYSATNYRLHLSHFWANVIFAIPT